MPEPAGTVITDSAGITCRYTRIADIEPGDVVIEGWRSTVVSRETDGTLYHLVFEGGHRSASLPPDTVLPVEVVAPSLVELRDAHQHDA